MTQNQLSQTAIFLLRVALGLMFLAHSIVLKLMVFTLIRAASKKWRRLKGANQLPLVVDGIKFTDGIAVSEAETRAA